MLDRNSFFCFTMTVVSITACHMVTAFVFLDIRMAPWTRLHCLCFHLSFEESDHLWTITSARSNTNVVFMGNPWPQSSNLIQSLVNVHRIQSPPIVI